MITKEKFRKEAKFDSEDEAFILSVYSKLFAKEINLKVMPEESAKKDEKDGITDRIIDISNDLINLDASNLALTQETVWKCFNHYGDSISHTLYEDDELYKKGKISKDDYQALNRQRQQECYDIYSKTDCWAQIGEPEYQTCLFPSLWQHRFGFITFYPEWEDEGLNILVRNGEIIGYANGIDPIVKAFDNPKLKSVYELWD